MQYENNLKTRIWFSKSLFPKVHLEKGGSSYIQVNMVYVGKERSRLAQTQTKAHTQKERSHRFSPATRVSFFIKYERRTNTASRLNARCAHTCVSKSSTAFSVQPALIH